MTHPTPDDLNHVPLLKCLTAQQLARLAEHMDVLPFAGGEELVRRGDRGSAFALVGKGSAYVSIGETVVGWLHRYDFFGELALLGEGRRRATVTAAEAGVAWIMDQRTFDLLEREHPEIASTIADAAADRLEADARLLVR